jgi:hypothetical protein
MKSLIKGYGRKKGWEPLYYRITEPLYVTVQEELDYGNRFCITAESSDAPTDFLTPAASSISEQLVEQSHVSTAY